MDLGNFSVSLAVKDIEASRSFYEKLGFAPFMGDAAQNWLVLRNGDHVIGLFQSMFDRNTLTFNPGWDGDANALDTFTDVREIQRSLKSEGIEIVTEVDESGSGPGYLMVVDPDDNPILIDQHV
jgi:lactoylglutathione lyase